MSLKSMTGFGRGERAGQGVRIEVEAGSVNRKQFDARVALPRFLQALEPRLIALARQKVSRGQLSVTVRIAAADAKGHASGLLDETLAAERIDELRHVAKRLKLPDDLSASTLVALREAVQRDVGSLDPELIGPLVEQAFAQALDSLAAMRVAEGRALEKTMVAYLRELRTVASKIKARAPKVVAKYRTTLRQRLKSAGIDCAPMDPVLAREVAVFADRADISEELDRLDSHFRQWETLTASDESHGRSMDFLCQEIFREINTVGSKANDAMVTRLVIQGKATLERMREQVQNVE